MQNVAHRVTVAADASGFAAGVGAVQLCEPRSPAVSSFREGVEAAIPSLRRYARALTRNAETADDLVQDTLVRALRAQHLFHGGELRSWLYTILTNLNRNRLRSLSRRPSLSSLEDDTTADLAG